MRVYNKDDLILTVKKAMGNRNIKSFASDSGLSSDYISRLLNGKFENSPKRNTLEKIASASDDVSLEELLQVSGYSKVPIPRNHPGNNSVLKASLLAALSESGLSWSVDGTNKEYSLTISCKHSSIVTWNFLFLELKDLKASKTFQDRLLQYYMMFLFKSIPSDTKISFVTADKDEFDIYRKNVPVNLSANISIILIDKDALNVKEELILSSVKDIEEIKIF